MSEDLRLRSVASLREKNRKIMNLGAVSNVYRAWSQMKVACIAVACCDRALAVGARSQIKLACKARKTGLWTVLEYLPKQTELSLSVVRRSIQPIRRFPQQSSVFPHIRKISGILAT
jgi:hypothetical protein